MTKSTFIQIYSSLPEDIRKEIIVVIEEKPYSWDAVYFEVAKETDLGKKILKKLESMELIQWTKKEKQKW